MRFGGKVLTVGAASIVVALVAFGGWFAWQSRSQETRFCYGLAIVVIDGHDTVLQDSNPPGPDPCDGHDTARTTWVLGLDCKVREPDGDVVTELEPNRPDGTCGLFEPGDGPYPDPWPTAD